MLLTQAQKRAQALLPEQRIRQTVMRASRAKSRPYPPISFGDPCRQMFLGIDPQDYRVRLFNRRTEGCNLRKQGDSMVFFDDFFNVEWCLPLDPFIAEFLIECDAVPVDLTLNTDRVLAAYNVMCRLLAFEPSIL